MNSLRDKLVAYRFFSGMQPAHLTLVAQNASEVKFKRDEMLFRESEPANRFFLLGKGKVALEVHDLVNGTVFIEELREGDVLGWSWLFPPFVWHFQARALEPTEAIALDGARLLIAAERDHDFGYELMKRVAQVVIHRLQAARHRLLADQIESVLKR
jgi:CRP/FNR family transcriptional regulator, cyclic AMP receptor protein